MINHMGKWNNTKPNFMKDLRRGLRIIENWKPQPMIVSYEVADILIKAGYVQRCL